MAIAITICRFCMVVLLVVLPGQCAPRSKGSKSGHRSAPQTVYDQKQTGDYNIQLHLKDFQIIALLGDDYFGGDYDYNYDYSDFTLKPSTHKPSTEAGSSPPSPTTSAPEKPSSTSTPSVAVSISTTPSKEPPVRKQETPATNKNPDKPAKPEAEKPSNEMEKPSTTSANVTEEVVEIVESSTVPQREKFEEPNSPGKIKVQIIETPVGIVPGEVSDKDSIIKEGEVLHIKRCAAGFGRDKLGRCRRLRRPGSSSPHLPYSFSRLANSLASRLRQSSSEESLPSSESSED
ncbi:uncharacterized protein LOC108904566 [Anoplophora glabripennis]|uniref:uncharacterized protein LOC108904566 n=1 Tax=Anoplophora glabripennis TaxID=217634 RepID=UPI0008737C24|nr:uncharacterized protein LOC108904566 [Anoplophora glabripennis]